MSHLAGDRSGPSPRLGERGCPSLTLPAELCGQGRGQEAGKGLFPRLLGLSKPQAHSLHPGGAGVTEGRIWVLTYKHDTL